MKLFILFLLLCVIKPSCSQSLSYPIGSRAIACGYTGIINRDIWAIYNNPAGTARLQGIHTGIFCENRFLIPELNRIAIGVFLPLKAGGIYASVDHMGGPRYSEMKAGIGYAMPFGEHFSAGIQLNYHMLTIGEGYGNHFSLTFEGGILARISEKLSLGLHIFNPLHMKWISTEEHIPVVFKAGIGYKPEKSIMLLAEINKSSDKTAIFCAGAEYYFQKKFYIRAGITSGTSRYTFGVGYNIRRIKIDISSSVHEWLGYSPQLSFTFISGK